MVRTHPQWLRALAIVRSGRIGPLRSITGTFSYFNDDPANVRNVPAYGGGALLDIGCYLVNTARMMFEQEPRRVCALVERDPAFGVDRLSSMLLDFPGGQAIGTCGTQLAAGQGVIIAGTDRPHRGRDPLQCAGRSPGAAVRRGADRLRDRARDPRDRHLRPVHDPGGPVRRGGAARDAGAVSAGRLHPEPAGPRRPGRIRPHPLLGPPRGTLIFSVSR